MSIKTHFTLDYLKNYLQRNNIEIPEECDIVSIFNSYDLYDQNLNEVYKEDGTPGDGKLQSYEARAFVEELKQYGVNLYNTVNNFRKEIFKQQENEILESPPKITDKYYEDESERYVYAKLKQLGIKNIDIDKIDNLLEQFDYDLDSDTNSYLTLEETAHKIIKYENDDDMFEAKKFLNKNQNGEYVDTHILDYIVNRYISKYAK